jgi:NAD-dependent deacetylase
MEHFPHISGNSEIFVLTGPGISKESGLDTFRDNDGLWNNHRVEDVATPEAFTRNPSLVYDFYNNRRRELNNGTKLNKAHLTLVELEKTLKINILCYYIDF